MPLRLTKAEEKEVSPPFWGTTLACCWAATQVPAPSTALEWYRSHSLGHGAGPPSQPSLPFQPLPQTSLHIQRASGCLWNCFSGSRFPVPHIRDNKLNWSTEFKGLTLKWWRGARQKKEMARDFVAAQRLRLLAPNAGGPDSIPCQGTKYHMTQLRVRMQKLKIPRATTKTWHSQIKRKFFKVNDKMNQAQSVTLESAWILSGYNDLWAVASCNQTEI